MLTTALVVMLVLLFSSIPVAAGLGYLAIILDELYSFGPLIRGIGHTAWATSTDVILVAVPMYILLGEIFLRSGIADRMYNAMTRWLSWMPGGIMHSNIGACMAFAATAGSSVATSATVSTVAVPLIKRYRYNERLFLGSLAAGGTLGILIPPSINLIVFGFLTDTSIPQLYLAGFIPGIVLGLLFMATIAVSCIVRPDWGGIRIDSTWRERIRSLPDLWPPATIFLLVIGSIYAGWATPTESASLGVCGAMLLTAFHGRLTFHMLGQAIIGTMRTMAMIMFILIAAWFLNFVLAAIGATTLLSRFFTGGSMTPAGTLFVVIAFYVVMGTFMEPMPLMVITVPTMTPIMTKLGYDPVWFGILIVLLCETALITAPVGANLYVVQGIRGHGSMNDVFIGSAPFVATLFLMILLICVFPQIALWLPSIWE